MCLITFAWQASAEYPFALVANRDEFHERPTQALNWWANTPVAAGRDLQAGGTWLGVTESGRFAAVTNVREGGVEQSAPLSRGALVTRALESRAPLDELEHELSQLGTQTAGFNLLYGDLFGARHELRYLSNRTKRAPTTTDSDSRRYLYDAMDTRRTLSSGIYALSNAGLNDRWPKTVLAEREMRRALRHRHPDGFWAVTDSRDVAEPDALPDTGIEPDVERFLSAAFIVGDSYGTRSTTRILSQPHASMSITERRFDPQGALTGSTHIRIDQPQTADAG